MTQFESLAQIRPPYPPHGTAEWWHLRRELERLIARDSRRRKVEFTGAQYRRSELARLTALGDEDARTDYERGQT